MSRRRKSLELLIDEPVRKLHRKRKWAWRTHHHHHHHHPSTYVPTVARFLRRIGWGLLVGRYGVSMFGAVVYLAKSVRRIGELDWGLQTLSCVIICTSCAVYCTTVNDDLAAILTSAVVRLNDALDEGEPWSCARALLVVWSDTLVAFLGGVLDIGQYRIWREMATAWNILCGARHAIRAIARGEWKVITRETLQWIESQTHLLHQLHHMWHAVAEVVTDVVHVVSDIVHNVTRTLSTRIAQSWLGLTGWMEATTRAVLARASDRGIGQRAYGAIG